MAEQFNIPSLFIGPNRRVDDAPRFAGTELRAAGNLLDAIALVSRDMDPLYALEGVNQAAAGIEKLLSGSRVIFPDEPVRNGELTVAQEAVAMGDTFLAAWWGSVIEPQPHGGIHRVTPSAKARELMAQHVKVASLFAQRFVKEGQGRLGHMPILLFSGMREAMHAIINNAPVHDHDKSLHRMDISYIIIEGSAQFLVDMWQLRQWEKSKLREVMEKAREDGSVLGGHDDPTVLAMPLVHLAGLDAIAAEQFEDADFLSCGPAASEVTSHIRKNALDFDSRNVLFRRVGRAISSIDWEQAFM